MKANRFITVLLGILMIATGICCLFTPAMTYLTLGYVVGVNMIVDAVGSIILWTERKKAGSADGWSLAAAIASLLFGVVLISSAALQLIMDMTVVYLAAAWLIVIGILRILFALRVRRVRKALDAELLGRRWWLVLTVGVLVTACGVFSLFNPSGLIVAIGINFGLNLILAGTNLIAAAV